MVVSPFMMTLIACGELEGCQMGGWMDGWMRRTYGGGALLFPVDMFIFALRMSRLLSKGKCGSAVIVHTNITVAETCI
jgi:hypothetical protein